MTNTGPAASDEPWPWPQYPRDAKRNYRRAPSEQSTGWEGDFLHALMTTGIVRLAAATANVSPRMAYNRRNRDSDFAQAWKLFQRYDDKGLSFTDCTILAQVERLELDAVFTFDAGFRKVGVKVVPGKA